MSFEESFLGAVPPPIDLQEMFFVACKEGNLEDVRGLCNLRVDINAVDKQGFSGLGLACWYGKIDIVRYLCEEQGMNLDALELDTYNVLHWACSQGDLPFVKYLCEERKADINALSHHGDNALHVATLFEQLEVVQYLCERPDAKIYLLNNAAYSVLYVSGMEGGLAIFQYLCEKYSLQHIEEVLIALVKNKGKFIGCGLDDEDDQEKLRSFIYFLLMVFRLRQKDPASAKKGASRQLEVLLTRHFGSLNQYLFNFFLRPRSSVHELNEAQENILFACLLQTEGELTSRATLWLNMVDTFINLSNDASQSAEVRQKALYRAVLFLNALSTSGQDNEEQFTVILSLLLGKSTREMKGGLKKLVKEFPAELCEIIVHIKAYFSDAQLIPVGTFLDTVYSECQTAQIIQLKEMLVKAAENQAALQKENDELRQQLKERHTVEGTGESESVATLMDGQSLWTGTSSTLKRSLEPDEEKTEEYGHKKAK